VVLVRTQKVSVDKSSERGDEEKKNLEKGAPRTSPGDNDK
jgi:hypothetical protein